MIHGMKVLTSNVSHSGDALCPDIKAQNGLNSTDLPNLYYRLMSVSVFFSNSLEALFPGIALDATLE